MTKKKTTNQKPPKYVVGLEMIELSYELERKKYFNTLVEAKRYGEKLVNLVERSDKYDGSEIIIGKYNDATNKYVDYLMYTNTWEVLIN